MRISGKPPQYKLWHQKQLENVQYLNYLDSTITNNSRCAREIKSRIATGKAAFNMKITLFISKLDLIWGRNYWIAAFVTQHCTVLKLGHFGK
jgi:hypothetical protein